MDIFQQWLLLKIQEQFGAGADPLKNEISFEAIAALIKPIFEQEGAPLDEEELRRNLDALVTLGYLTAANGTYFLTLRAMVHSQVSTSLPQMMRDELANYVSRYWWQAGGIALLIIFLISIVASTIVVNILK